MHLAVLGCLLYRPKAGYTAIFWLGTMQESKNARKDNASNQTDHTTEQGVIAQIH